MPEYVPEGALIPKGIDVDETAAYFGITQSSQILVDMEECDRYTSLTLVLNKISDLLLTDTFDLDSGSNRLNVESGEIYYILTGPLELLTLTENLQEFLGLNPEGDISKPNISEEQYSSLEALLDPINILKIYAIGEVTGGNQELAKYVSAFDEMISKPEENIEQLIQIRNEMMGILNETKNMQIPRPISILTSSKEVDPPIIITKENTTQITANSTINTLESNEIKNIPEKTTQLQTPTELKPPSNKNYFEATPLPKPEKSDKDNYVEKSSEIYQKNQNMRQIEKNSLNTEKWINKEENDKINEKPNNFQKIIPKSKPINIEPITKQKNLIDSTNNEKVNYHKAEKILPKPKQKNIIQTKSNYSTNEIMRTFPNGLICGGCGVSLSNSWRFCPLCGFNSKLNL